jgi:bleomycin hydrolase
MNPVTVQGAEGKGLKRKRDSEEGDPLSRATHAALKRFRSDPDCYGGEFVYLQFNSLSRLAVKKVVEIPDLKDFHINLGTDIEVEDQESSGNCWILGGLNLIKRAVIQKYGNKDFRLSQNYITYYMCMAEARKTLLEGRRGRRARINEGGDFRTFSFLVQRYGLVPSDAMPDTYHTGRPREFYSSINSLLLRYCFELDNNCEETVDDKLIHFSQQLMKFLGPVPDSFEFEIDGEARTIEPKEFFPEILPEFDLKDYRIVERAERKSSLDEEKLDTLYLNDRDLVNALKSSLKNGRTPIISYEILDHSWMRYSESGNLILYDGLRYLNIADRFKRIDRMRYKDYDEMHEVALVGVHFGAYRKPKFWLCENSHGKSAGLQGYEIIPHELFLKAVFDVVIHKDDITKRVLSTKL